MHTALPMNTSLYLYRSIAASASRVATKACVVAGMLVAMLAADGARAQDTPTPPASAPSSAAPPGTPAATPATPATPALPPAPAATSPAPAEPLVDPRPTNRLTGIETDRNMIAAEAPTQIVVNGTPGSSCAIAVDFGDGTRSTHIVSESTPFPLSLAHTYPKMADLMVRVSGFTGVAAPPCEGIVEASVHISPAGSKIEYITLAINACPEGWSLVGQVNADKSFKCTPIPDASAPTNLIHCTEGMKYFARGGNVGCAHPAVAVESVAQAATGMKGGPKGGKGPMGKSGMSPAKGKAARNGDTKGPVPATKKPAP